MDGVSSNYQKHETRNPMQRWLIDRFYVSLFELVGPLPVTTILDAGCGEGFTMHRLYTRWPERFRLAGVDASAEAVAAGTQLHPSLNMQEGSIYALPYPNQSFDLVVCTEVLEHLEEPARALAEIRRVSRGYALLSVPREPLFRAANFLRGKNLGRFGNDIEHIQHWSSMAFQKFVADNGFKVMAMRQPFPWTMLLVRTARERG